MSKCWHFQLLAHPRAGISNCVFGCLHIQALAHPSAAMFQCLFVQLLAHASACTFKCIQLQVLAHPSAGKLKLLHIQVLAHPSACTCSACTFKCLGDLFGLLLAVMRWSELLKNTSAVFLIDNMGVLVKLSIWHPSSSMQCH